MLFIYFRQMKIKVNCTFVYFRLAKIIDTKHKYERKIKMQIQKSKY
ncbi:hypothetical protein PJIAN_1818 [Paludibacter jiangxiensis]|uniref:Uncharacterized protein n=1 Tax=Paludibacter jiangxiensis TaxID=681398 RepID=A0A161LDF9_9BACT|nr:hypothetical protein PJIAN_1818 [Paludibacter jiangxiensis]